MTLPKGTTSAWGVTMAGNDLSIVSTNYGLAIFSTKREAVEGRQWLERKGVACGSVVQVEVHLVVDLESAVK